MNVSSESVLRRLHILPFRYLLVDFGLAQRLCPAPEETPAAPTPPPAHCNGLRKRMREEVRNLEENYKLDL